MSDKDQKIIHRWNYKFEKSTWTTESSKNVGDVLDSLDQISAINFEYRLAFCVLHAPLEQIAALALRSKIMSDKDQKIIHRWNYKFEKSTWTTESSKNVGDVLDSLKLGLSCFF
jgi:DNA/RNA-binding domain of Phe-tRNA-synthetase-like protein